MLEKQSNQARGIRRRTKRTRGEIRILVAIFLISLILSMPSISRGIVFCDPAPILTVTKSGNGTGTVTSAPGGINCGVDCQEGFPINCPSVVMTLTATPDAGSAFVGWSGDTDCSDGKVTMEVNKTCIALFRLLSSDWEISRIDDVKGSYSSIAVDTKDKVHVAYEAHHADGTAGDLKYATNATGHWVTTTVDSTGGVGISSSIALDPLNKAHISYYDWLNLDLKYATNAKGSWSTTTIDSAGNVGATTAIAVDKNNWAHIVYTDASLSGINLKYATNTTGSWVTSTIDNSGGVCPGGLTMDIAGDFLGYLHIGYCHSGGLMYTTNATGSWVTTTVDPNGGLDVSIALDSSNNPHMSYYQIDNNPSPGFGNLMYATNDAMDSWSTTTVDSTGDTGGRTSIAVTQDKKVHISYYDFTNQDIRYATNASGAWVMETIDSGYVGEFTATSLALDSNAKVHISYYTGADAAQMVGYGPLYATNAEGLSVIPGDGFSSSGYSGGPFTPLSKEYILTNMGATPISWSATKTKAWVKLSKTGGTLAAGATVVVSVSIVSDSAKMLDAGTFDDTVTFTNKTTYGIATATRTVNLSVSSINISSLSPPDLENYSVCSCYPAFGPPTFSWDVNGGTLKILELQFYAESNPSKIVKVKASATELSQESLQLKASIWKSILLLAGATGGEVDWKAVGTKQNNNKVESNMWSFIVAAPEGVGDPQVDPTSKAVLPTLSWKNNCNSKFKVWFYNDPEYYDNPTKVGVKKIPLSFPDSDPVDNLGIFTKALTSAQWTSIQNVVGKASGAKIYWHIESSDVVSTNRIAKTARQEFTLQD